MKYVGSCNTCKFNIKIYKWALANLPYQIMYKKINIDTQHEIWIPRWGYTKDQIKDVERKANELFDSINWE